jgi:hypothetical protein
MAARSWLLLIYQLPSRHSPARVKVWRRLQRIGAVLLKNSAWVMPESDDAREDFEWLKAEIVASGGEAMVLVAHAPQKATDDEVVAAFQAARARDVEALRKDASKLLERLSTLRGLSRRSSEGTRGAKGDVSRRSSEGTGGAKAEAKSPGRALPQALRRIRERARELEAIDFFRSPSSDEVGQLVAQLERHARRGQAMRASTEAAGATLAVKDFKKKIWVTRPRPGVDRMASAWLIRRAIDANAAFVFRTKPRGSEIPFDMYIGDFGHHGEMCTFETLAARFGLRDPAVTSIAQIVHDLDMKEARYNRPEAPAVGRLVEGLRQMHKDDATLLEQGIAMFEALARSFA